MRQIVALVVYGGAALIFFRFVMAHGVFLSMRDYQREIKREMLLEKRIAQEIEERFQQYQKHKEETKKKKKSKQDQPSTSSKSATSSKDKRRRQETP